MSRVEISAKFKYARKVVDTKLVETKADGIAKVDYDSLRGMQHMIYHLTITDHMLQTMNIESSETGWNIHLYCSCSAVVTVLMANKALGSTLRGLANAL